jgi:nucleotide-binding universal stress UspA family protein
MKTIVVGVQDSPGARAAVRIAAAFAQGLGGRLVAVPAPEADEDRNTNRTRRDNMSATAATTRVLETSSAVPTVSQAPIVAAVDSSASSQASIETAVRLGRELDAPLVFVYVRRGPAGFWGTPVYQRRLTAEMTRARRALDAALLFAERAGVVAEAEILEGKPQRRILEFAGYRGARLVVVGSRGRRFGRSVSTGVIRAAERPVVVARRPAVPLPTYAVAA